MRFKLFGMFAALALLAACESSSDSQGTMGGTGGGLAPISAPSTDGSIAGRGAPRPGSQEDLEATAGDRVFFDLDRSDLKAEARGTVERWAQWLRQYPNVTVTIEGHADERGTREYNLALGERRASSTKNFLVSLGIDGRRVATISYGKERPAVVGSNEAAWAQNRRAVMVVN